MMIDSEKLLEMIFDLRIDEYASDGYDYGHEAALDSVVDIIEELIREENK